jgi:hypothetical protein
VMTLSSTELARLVEALQQSWSADTSAYDDWTDDAPTRGQCAVTTLVVQDHVGGEVVRAIVAGGSHYWNRLPDDTDFDLTRGQFSVFEPQQQAVSSRQYILSSPSTRRRYELLRRAVEKHLAAGSPT